MRVSIRSSLFWIFLGPVFALLISMVSRIAYEYVSPDKLSGIAEMLGLYPLGLLISVLTPWGWLMYGGFLLMNAGKSRIGIACTLAGAVILGLFWPVWSTFLVIR